MMASSSTNRLSLMRLWQPRSGLFWLVVGLNVLTSAQVVYIQFADPAPLLRGVIGLMALTNTVIGWWLLARLWREAPAARTQAVTPAQPES